MASNERFTLKTSQDVELAWGSILREEREGAAKVRRPAILMVSGAYPPALCGVGDYTRNLCDALASRGAQVTVVTSSYLGVQSTRGNPRVVPAIKGWSLSRSLGTLRSILSNRGNVCHFQMQSDEFKRRSLPFLLPSIVGVICKHAKVVVTIHELPSFHMRPHRLRGLLRFVKWWLCLNGVDGVVVVAESYKEDLGRRFRKVRRIPCQVIPISSNIPRSKTTPVEMKKVRHRWGLPDDTCMLAYFGFINPTKGFENVLDVLAALRRQHMDVRLVVVGELSPQDRYHTSISDRIVRDGLKPYIEITGHLAPLDVADLLAVADACILPFRDGVHPKNGSFLAALAQGTFTVVTHIEKRGYYDQENVFYAAPDDVQSMADAIMAFRGRRVEPNRLFYDWELIADEHLRFYAALCGAEGFPCENWH